MGRVNVKSDFFKQTVTFSAIASAIVHFAFIAYFFLVKVPFMGYYNILSTAFFLAMFFALKRNVSAMAVFIAMSLEVVLHALLATYYLGVDSGFLSYFLILPLIFLLHPKWRIWQVGLYYSVIILFYSLSYLYAKRMMPIVPLPEWVISLSSFANILLIGIVVFLVLAEFKRQVRINTRKVMLANESLAVKNEQIQQQMQQQEALVKEVHHRVKNNLQLISSMLNLQVHQLEDAETIKILRNCQDRIRAISIIHKRLYQGKENAAVDLKNYLNDLVSALNYINPDVKCEIEAIHLFMDLDMAVPLGLITTELLTNSFKHAFDEPTKGKVFIQLTQLEEKKYELLISDNGKGLPKDFKARSSKSLGMELVKGFSKQIGAEVHFSYNDQGTKSSLQFDLSA